MPAIVARSVIAGRNSDHPPSENLTNTALSGATGYKHVASHHCAYYSDWILVIMFTVGML